MKYIQECLLWWKLLKDAKYRFLLWYRKGYVGGHQELGSRARQVVELAVLPGRDPEMLQVNLTEGRKVLWPFLQRQDQLRRLVAVQDLHELHCSLAAPTDNSLQVDLNNFVTRFDAPAKLGRRAEPDLVDNMNAGLGVVQDDAEVGLVRLSLQRDDVERGRLEDERIINIPYKSVTVVCKLLAARPETREKSISIYSISRNFVPTHLITLIGFSAKMSL